MLVYVCVCARRPRESVREVIELAGQYIVIPFSNSQAHRIADKYSCSKFFVNDDEALKKLVEAMKKYVKGKYEVIEINDIREYPRVDHDHIEVLVKNDMYIEHYSTEYTDGYYGRYRGVEINITNSPL